MAFVMGAPLFEGGGGPENSRGHPLSPNELLPRHMGACEGVGG